MYDHSPQPVECSECSGPHRVGTRHEVQMEPYCLTCRDVHNPLYDHSPRYVDYLKVPMSHLSSGDRIRDMLMYKDGTMFCRTCDGPHDPATDHETPESDLTTLLRSLEIDR